MTKCSLLCLCVCVFYVCVFVHVCECNQVHRKGILMLIMSVQFLIMSAQFSAVAAQRTKILSSNTSAVSSDDFPSDGMCVHVSCHGSKGLTGLLCAPPRFLSHVECACADYSPWRQRTERTYSFNMCISPNALSWIF